MALRAMKDKESPRKERLEVETFIVKMEEKRKNVALWVILAMAVAFTIVVILQAMGYAHLSPKPFYAIVASSVGTVAYTIRKVFKRR